jgi:glycosyltransferase involved in cell wall biosynthesis
LGLGDAFTWLSVGRLTEAKRHADLIDAMRLVCARHPGARLLIAGIGPLHRALEEQIEGLELADNIRLLGLRDDVPALMQAADGFALSSAWEGLPMVLLESAASSLPIVATDVGGSRDVVDEGDTGYLVPARQPDLLAEQMLRLMALSPIERQAMGARARASTIAAFDLERIADRWKAIYRRD